MKMRILSCVFMAWMIGQALAAVIHVKPAETGLGDGSSWANATTLPEALVRAESGDEIWVAAGVHKPSTSEADRRLATFQLKMNVAVYGGFSGRETLRSRRDFVNNRTILSGDIDDNDSQTPVVTDARTVDGLAGNSYHVVTGASDAVLDGFTITAGNADVSGNAHGGGLYNPYGRHPALANLIFSGNCAINGGGMVVLNADPPLFNILFTGNVATQDGGGLYCGASDSSLTNVSFVGNSAASAGGGMHVTMGSPGLTNVTFSGNSAGSAGALALWNRCQAVLRHVTFTGNSAVRSGGALVNLNDCHPLIENSIFWNNTAPLGAEIHNETAMVAPSAPAVRYCVVQGGYSDGTNIVVTDPRLGAAGDHGGFTWTVPLGENSSAIGAADPTNSPGTDQRGFSRHEIPDIGAYEYEGNGLPRVITRPVTGVMAMAAVGNGQLAVPGHPLPTAHGVCWNTTGWPEVADSHRDLGPAAATGDFSLPFYGLTPNTTYYLRAYATNPAGTVYGGEEIFTTTSVVASVVETREVQAVTWTTATVVSELVTLGDPVPEEYGLCWGTDEQPDLSGPHTHETEAPSLRSYVTALTGLTANVLYHARAYATSAAGTVYGQVLSFRPHEPGIIYVKPVGAGTAGGFSWDNACTLSYALAVAARGDEIWVAEGVHKPDFAAISDPRRATFQLQEGTAVYGGFGGTETLRGQRDPAVHPTILSGDIANDDSQQPVITDITTVTNHTNNCYHVVTGASDCWLDGFTITAGYADINFIAYLGGGMECANIQNQTVANCLFSGNYGFNGGGICCGGSSLNLINLAFVSNQSPHVGGGVCSQGSSLVITNVTFSGNLAGAGGGIFAGGSSRVRIANSTFSRNQALNGGAIGVFHDGLATMLNCVIWDGQVFSEPSAGVAISHSVVEGGFPGGTGIISEDPLLGPLGSYGGFPPVIPLLPGSPAIDTGTDDGAPAGDQRGVLRPAGRVDMGAFESQGFVLTRVGGDDQATVISTAFPSPLLTGVTANQAIEPVDGGVVTFSGPATGAGTASAENRAVIAGGLAGPILTANGTAGGPYRVTARAAGAATANGVTGVDFHLTNLPVPDTAIVSGPADPTAQTAADFSFRGSGGEGELSFQYQLDGSGSWTSGDNPLHLEDLVDGRHELQARSVDTRGNADPAPAVHNWTVDTVAPDTTISSYPPNPGGNPVAVFHFAGSDPGGSGVARFESALDGTAWGVANSPLTLTGLGDGSHTFQVRAIDAAGNVDSAPATYTWVVDTTAPVMSVLHGAVPVNAGGGFDFGDRAIHTSLDEVFTIQNTGTAPLQLTLPLILAGAQPDQFSLPVQPATPVVPGGHTTFTIRFTPASAGAKTATLAIGNNDRLHNPYDLTFSGTGQDGLLVSGTVTVHGRPLAGVTITFSHDGHTEITGPDGAYRYTVPYQTSTVLTPSHPGYTGWVLPNRSLDHIISPRTGQDFSATEDNDGVPAEMEQGPDGSDSNFDGNGDGMPDRLQPRVVSLLTPAGAYVTLAGPDGTRFGWCQALPAPAAGTGPEAVIFPYGLLAFSIEDLELGGAVTVQLHLPAGAAVAGYWKQGPEPEQSDPHWYDFAYEAESGTGAETGGNPVLLHFVDGQRGDDRLEADRRIEDAGGPVVAAPIPTLTEWGMLLLLVLTAVAGSLIIHRR